MYCLYADNLIESGVGKKLKKIIYETLPDTASKVKFYGDSSEPFVIRMGIR